MLQQSSIIEFQLITKIFGAFKALENISFNVEQNHIHAIIGENGAGKSTLMNVLVGIEPASSGEMKLRGSVYKPKSALDSFNHRIGFVHQHFQLADELTGWDHLNLVISTQNIDQTELVKRVNETQKKFSWNLPLSQKIKEYTIGEQQQLEILRVLILKPEIIIFDEPTAVLSPNEISDFLNFMLELKKQGHTLLLISHKLNEIKAVADRITILCRGRLIATQSNAELSVQQMAEKMIGRPQQPLTDNDKTAEDTKVITIKEASLDLRTHEIMGVAGVNGNGQEELIKKVKQSVESQGLKLGDIAEDRFRYSIYPSQSLVDNFLIRHRAIFTNSWGIIKRQNLLSEVKNIIEQWDVRPGDPDMSMGSLSGGNQQKFVIGRELWHNPDVILAAYPSRGVDIGAQEKIHQELIHEKNKGKAIVLVSADLDEIIHLSDRFVIMFKGQIFGPYFKNQLTPNQMSQVMNGVNL